MRILFVCENYLPHYGGAEVVFKNLAEGYATKGHRVSVITHRLKATGRNEMINGVNVQRIPSFHSRYVFTFSAIPAAIRAARKSDIIQTTTFNGAFPAWLAGKLTGKPVVLTVHEVWIGRWKEVTGFSWWKRAVHEFLERLIYLLPFDRYVCVSNATERDFRKIKHIRGENMAVVYNGFNAREWNPAEVRPEEVESVRREMGDEGQFIYFAWGRPGESKGFDLLINAVPEVIRRAPHFRFRLVLMFGSIGTYRKKYKQLMALVAKQGLPQHIKVLPSVPHHQLARYVKAADCVVVPSIAEGFGFNALEAITMGAPLVASDAGSLPEVVSGKHLLFKSKDVHHLAETMIKAAQGEYAKTPLMHFPWQISIEKYLNIYKDLCHEYGRYV